MKGKKYIKGSAEPVNIQSTKKILEQMINCICKIKIKGEKRTGFFGKIPLEDNNKIMKCLMTNYHIINKEYIKKNKEINLLLNDDNEVLIINLEINRKIYFNEEYDIAIIELKDIDNIKEYLELDDNLFKNNEKIFYEEESIYILQYPHGDNACVSYGILNEIDNYNIKHLCTTDNGSSGSPILNLKNNKVIGIHKIGSKNYNFNYGTLLKYPINDFIKNNKNINNKITAEIYINKDDINKNIQIINTFENCKRVKSWPDSKDDSEYNNEKEIKDNIEIKINEKMIKFAYYYKFMKEGNYKIEYSFKSNLTKINHMFFDCYSLKTLISHILILN